jgi:hypothetical protein
VQRLLAVVVVRQHFYDKLMPKLQSLNDQPVYGVKSNLKQNNVTKSHMNLFIYVQPGNSTGNCKSSFSIFDRLRMPFPCSAHDIYYAEI